MHYDIIMTRTVFKRNIDLFYLSWKRPDQEWNNHMESNIIEVYGKYRKSQGVNSSNILTVYINSKDYLQPTNVESNIYWLVTSNNRNQNNILVALQNPDDNCNFNILQFIELFEQENYLNRTSPDLLHEPFRYCYTFEKRYYVFYHATRFK